MPVQFKNPNTFPPDGFIYSDPHTGMKFDDAGLDLNAQAKLIAEHRKGNPRIYSLDEPKHFDHAAIVAEIAVQRCAQHPQYCEDGAFPGEPYPRPQPPAELEVVHIQGKKCPKCGGMNFTPVRCRTCGGGGRISGHKCLACGLES